MIQKIKVDDQEFNVFFDSGCSDMVIRHEAVLKLGKRAKQELKGPISIGGVGNLEIESVHGVYRIRLPLLNGKDAVLAGVCLDRITNTFPVYPIHGEVKEDICNAYKERRNNEKDLPKLPDFVGGDIDIMVGAKYLRYHPHPVFSLSNGLTVFESVFPGVDGNNGIIGGPHRVFTEIDRERSKNCQYVYCTPQFPTHCYDSKCNNLPCLDVNDHSTHCFSFPEEIKCVEKTENTVSEISYRCTNCHQCQKCKEEEHIQFTSIEEGNEVKAEEAEAEEVNLKKVESIAKTAGSCRQKKKKRIANDDELDDLYEAVETLTTKARKKKKLKKEEHMFAKRAMAIMMTLSMLLGGLAMASEVFSQFHFDKGLVFLGGSVLGGLAALFFVLKMGMLGSFVKITCFLAPIVFLVPTYQVYRCSPVPLDMTGAWFKLSSNAADITKQSYLASECFNGHRVQAPAMLSLFQTRVNLTINILYCSGRILQA